MRRASGSKTGTTRAKTCSARRWTRPPRYDHDVVVIGAGPAGLVSAYIAAAVKAKVALVEAHRMVALFFGAMGINEHAKVKVRSV